MDEFLDGLRHARVFRGSQGGAPYIKSTGDDFRDAGERLPTSTTRGGLPISTPARMHPSKNFDSRAPFADSNDSHLPFQPYSVSPSSRIICGTFADSLDSSGGFLAGMDCGAVAQEQSEGHSVPRRERKVGLNWLLCLSLLSLILLALIAWLSREMLHNRAAIAALQSNIGTVIPSGASVMPPGEHSSADAAVHRYIGQTAPQMPVLDSAPTSYVPKLRRDLGLGVGGFTSISVKGDVEMCTQLKTGRLELP